MVQYFQDNYAERNPITMHKARETNSMRHIIKNKGGAINMDRLQRVLLYTAGILACLLRAFLFCCLLFFVFVYVVSEPKDHFPAEGVWVCEEQEIRIDFESGICTLNWNDETLTGAMENDPGSTVIGIHNTERNNNDYYLGEEIVAFELVRSDDLTMTFKELVSEKTYIFIKQE